MFNLLRIILENSDFISAVETLPGTRQLYFQYRINIKTLNKAEIWDNYTEITSLDWNMKYYLHYHFFYVVVEPKPLELIACQQ